MDFDALGQILIMHYAFVKYLRQNGNTTKQCFRYFYTSGNPIILLGGRSFIILILSVASP